jgi:hypothetical protein
MCTATRESRSELVRVRESPIDIDIDADADSDSVPFLVPLWGLLLGLGIGIGIGIGSNNASRLVSTTGANADDELLVAEATADVFSAEISSTSSFAGGDFCNSMMLERILFRNTLAMHMASKASPSISGSSLP